MLLQRLISAALGIPVVAAIIWVGGGLLAALVAAAVFIAVIEIAAARGVARTPASLVAAGLGAVLPPVALANGDWLFGAVALAIVVPSTLFTLSKEPRAALDAWLWGIATALYFGVLATHFVLLREHDNGRDWLFFTVITVWVTDTGAYFVGRAIGRRKLAPAISPGKTVEGAIGSAVAGLAAVFVLDAAFGLDLALGHRIALGLLLPPVIMVGDLAESALKRALGVKDSGVIVPGHGGIADRLDSLLFAAPAVFYYLLAFNL